MSGIVEITEIFTRKKWFRKIGDGPMEEVDLLPYDGVVPLVFLDDTVSWVMQKSLKAEEEIVQKMDKGMWRSARWKALPAKGW